jgi:hypothetical protein
MAYNTIGGAALYIECTVDRFVTALPKGAAVSGDAVGGESASR